MYESFLCQKQYLEFFKKLYADELNALAYIVNSYNFIFIYKRVFYKDYLI